MRLLVVEDDPKIASFLTKEFQEAGFAVDHFANGEEGLMHACKTPYDVAIVDLMLPGLDGLSLIEQMRTQKVQTPAIVLSDGIGCDGFAWKYLQPHLAKTHRVLHWHYRAHGRSDVLG